jgi:hypothetical protein
MIFLKGVSSQVTILYRELRRVFTGEQQLAAFA